MATTPAQLRAAIVAASLPNPHPAFLATILTPPLNRLTLPPLPALVATARHRLLTADLTAQCVLESSSSSFPRNLDDPRVKTASLTVPLFVQVLSVEDMSKSRWEQIEAIEAVERGEMTRGREIIRIAPGADESDEHRGGASGSTQTTARGRGATASTNASAPSGKAGPHKLILQDWKGNCVAAIEQKPVEGVGLGMDIGSKMELKSGIVVARGMILLRPEKSRVVGGKIDRLHDSWLKNRKADLRRALEENRIDGSAVGQGSRGG